MSVVTIGIQESLGMHEESTRREFSQEHRWLVATCSCRTLVTRSTIWHFAVPSWESKRRKRRRRTGRGNAPLVFLGVACLILTWTWVTAVPLPSHSPPEMARHLLSTLPPIRHLLSSSPTITSLLAPPPLRVCLFPRHPRSIGSTTTTPPARTATRNRKGGE